MPTAISDLLLADRIWIAVALLHQESPTGRDFSKDDIRRKLNESGLADGTKPGSVNAHLKEHLVANVPPSSTKYRMLFETRDGRLRLFRPGDDVDAGRIQSRKPSKSVPRRDEISQKYRFLLDWYEKWIATPMPSEFSSSPPRSTSNLAASYDDDPLIRLIGSGKHIWADEHADEYVENLRREDR
jgi:hypothetical protein